MTDSPDSGAPTTPEAWLQNIRELERQGMFLRAYDMAARALEAYPDDPWLRHRAVLVLARAGSTTIARQRFAELGLLERAEDPSIDAKLREDIWGLHGRLLKDEAQAGAGAGFHEAAASYHEAFRILGGYYTAINAATLFYLDGDLEQGRRLARAAIEAVDAGAPADNDEDRYYELATRAEAALLLAEDDRAADLIAEAAPQADGNWAAKAATLRQLRLICVARDLDTAFLDCLRNGDVLHYTGHMIVPPGQSGRFEAAAEPDVAARIAAFFDGHDFGFVYGSLACGADILCAEAALAAGAELNVVLPFEQTEFIAISVAPGGPQWEARFDDCLGRAKTVSYSTEDQYLGDDLLFQHCARLAMGLSVLRARYVASGAGQLAVWDGEPARQAAGTAADVAFWKNLSRESHVISPLASGASRQPSKTASGGGKAADRKTRAMLFGDIKGFSKLGEAQLLTFVAGVLGVIAETLEGYDAHIDLRNTWGDGIFIVFDDVFAAADCALALQEAVDAIDLAALGLPSFMGLRLGAHYGPVFERFDPILNSRNFFGVDVSKAARIEPITPEGCVYVTEPMAASLALDGENRFTCDYVGTIPAAKNYGEFPMYLLGLTREGRQQASP